MCWVCWNSTVLVCVNVLGLSKQYSTGVCVNVLGLSKQYSTAVCECAGAVRSVQYWCVCVCVCVNVLVLSEQYSAAVCECAGSVRTVDGLGGWCRLC